MKKVKQRKRQRRAKPPDVKSWSEYMRGLANQKWDKYRKKIEEGTLALEPFKPKGPMPPEQRQKAKAKKLNSRISNAQLFRHALHKDRLTPGQVRTIIGEHRKPRRYIPYGGKRPEKFQIRYGRVITKIVKQIRRRIEELEIQEYAYRE